MKNGGDLRDMSAYELLGLLQELGEHERIEAKRASQIGPSVLETVCAFANEPGLEGGCLLLGVEEDQNILFPQFRFSVAGIENADKISNDLVSQCRTLFNVPISPRIVPEKLDGKVVLRVWIAEAAPANKPIYFQSDGLPQGAFRRVGAGDIPCTEDDLAVFYDAKSHETFDAGIPSDAEMNDLDEEAIDFYRDERAKVDANAEELNWNNDDLLRALGCARLDNGRLRPTVAGVLLFGTKMALRRLFPMTRVDYIRVPGKTWVKDPDKRFDSIDMRDPIMRLVRRAQAAILEDLPTAFSLPLEDLQREANHLVDPRVWREAIVNALMHRSYRNQSAVQIIRYSNRLEIRNAGYSLKSPERLGEPESQMRNPKIAAVLYDTRFAETKGSGVRVMNTLMEAAGLSSPLFESSRGDDNFVATFYFHHFLSPEDWKWLAVFKAHNLSDEESKALVFVREHGAIDNLTYRNLNKVETLDASRHLVRLRDCGLLAPKGGGNKIYYVAGEGFAPFPLPENYHSQPLSDTQPVKLNQKEDELDEERDGFNAKRDELSEKKDGLHERERELISSLPPEMQNDLLSLRSFGDKASRAQATHVEEFILRLCALRNWRGDELAVLLNRRAPYLRKKYLWPMIARGVLEYMYAENKSHPAQAYRTAPEPQASARG